MSGNQENQHQEDQEESEGKCNSDNLGSDKT